jgi:peptide/nickel transport system permease protein
MAIRRARHHPGLLVGAAIFLLIVAIALLAPWLAPYDPYAQDLINRLKPPFWEEGSVAGHWLGTDALGRDYLSRLLYGARVSLMIGLFTALVSGLIGTTLGVLAGYFGGRVDLVVSFLITTRLSMPVVLVALAVVAVIGNSLVTVIGVLGLLLWDRFAVVMRSATRSVASLDYVTSARALGCSLPRILLGEILPNVSSQLVVVVTLEMAHAILLEAALSFLGLGVQPPTPSWGLMISEGKKYQLFDAWLIVIPGVALVMLILAINLLGDGIRDVSGPEGRN